MSELDARYARGQDTRRMFGGGTITSAGRHRHCQRCVCPWIDCWYPLDLVRGAQDDAGRAFPWGE